MVESDCLRFTFGNPITYGVNQLIKKNILFKLNILFLFYSLVNPRILMSITVSIKKNGLILCLADFVIQFQNTYSINALAHFIIFIIYI